MYKDMAIHNRLIFIRSIARQAGRRLLDFFRKDLSVKKKALSGFVSNADFISSELLYTSINNKFANDGYLCEERQTEKVSCNEFKWIIDPLDGTTNFIRGNSEFSVSVGLTKKDVPVLGLVYAPYRKETYWAVKGQGAWVEYEVWDQTMPLKVSRTSSLKNSIIEFPAAYEIDHRAEKQLKMMSLFYPGVRLRASESAALALCKVASGETDAYLHPTEQPYDFAAGAIIVSEAGGVVTSYLNNTLSTKKRGLVAGNAAMHQEIIHILGNTPLALLKYWLEDES